MASVFGKVKIGDTEYTLLSCSYSISQPTDAYGIPNDIPRGNLINLTVQTNGVNSSLVEWASQPKLKKDGQITYTNIEGSSGQTFDFYDGYCVFYGESFSAGSNNNSDAVMASVTISAMKVLLHGLYAVTIPGFENLGSSGNTSSGGAKSDSNVSSFIAD
ncbi:type VI secretion system tube protein TssD [Taibaiella koreensis]|uniref:type VI secretion system tube protein TssD n=1 Tax=Taibaiella koreensis TaxID=1268548 RepID=UPI000E59CD86|nr:type VI secretion system tube protein TssD [Taibaiella koreensis]